MRAERLKLSLLSALIAGASMSASLACLASCPAELNSAIADYNAKKYQSAIAKLQKVSRANKDNPHTRYYLGLCYQAIGNWAFAKREFKWNYDNSKDATIRYKSWSAFTALEQARRSAQIVQTNAHNAPAGAVTQAAPKDPHYNPTWGSAASLNKPAQVLNGSDYETITVTPKACGS